MEVIRWGILGTGYAAAKFAQGLKILSGAKLLAVGSRKRETADGFAVKFDVPRKYSRYEELAADKDIDIVYIATPHVFHKSHCLLCLESGKAVLCEKPFTINAQEAKEVIGLARKKRLFCMEGMWTRFIPLIQKTREWIGEGMLGDIKMLTADFGLRIRFDENDRHFNPDLGGGALLDLGIYPISLAYYLMGPPQKITCHAVYGKTHIDEQAVIIFSYDNGGQAVLSAGFLTNMPNEAAILGTKGMLKIDAPIYRPHKLSIHKFSEEISSGAGGKQGRLSRIKRTAAAKYLYHAVSPLIRPTRTKRITIPYKGNGYNHEAGEAMKCLRKGKLESAVMPLDETLRIMETLDEIRSRWTLVYPSENQK